MQKIVRSLALCAVAVGSLIGITGGTANAQGFSIQFGSPGYYRPWHHHYGSDYGYYHRPYYRHYGYYDGDYGGCRVIVRRHVNPWGEVVVSRRRVCY